MFLTSNSTLIPEVIPGFFVGWLIHFKIYVVYLKAIYLDLIDNRLNEYRNRIGSVLSIGADRLIENQLKGCVFAKQAMITSPFTKVKKFIVIK